MTMIKKDLKSFIAGMPKAENHCHLDGSTYPETAMVLSERNNVPLPFSSQEEAEELFQYKSLDDFIRLINDVCNVIQTEDDFAYLVEKLGEEAASQNVKYRDVMLSNYYHKKRGISYETQMKGFIRGREAVLKHFGISLVCIPEIDRTMPPEESLAFVKEVLEYADEANIKAIGLDGMEKGYPAHRHRSSYDYARNKGLSITHHAGEDCGPESIIDSLDSGAERIDHGVRAIEDEELIERLIRDKILLTVCPLSNISLKVYPDLAHHSFKKLFDAGVSLTINSDDPPFFGGDLNRNYYETVKEFRFGKEDLLKIGRTAFERSFAPEAEIQKGISELESYFEQYTYEV